MLRPGSRQPAALGLALTLALLVVASCGSDPEPADQAAPSGSSTTAAPTAPSTTAAGEATPAARSCVDDGDPSPDVAARVEAMGTREKIGQLLMPHVYGADAATSDPAARRANRELYGVDTAAEVVRRWKVGGVIYIGQNTVDPARGELTTGNATDGGRAKALSRGLQDAATGSGLPGLLVAVDQEGGPVQRFGPPVPDRPAAAEFAAAGDTTVTRDAAGLTAAALRDLGVNVNLAPVADVLRADSSVIGERSYGADPAVVGRHVVAAVEGTQQEDVAATVKHYPGHGGTTIDSHAQLPVIGTSQAQWEAVDRPPFEAAVDAGVCLVMTGHLAFPALDGGGVRPATLSPVVIDERLRAGLGFDGVVVSDSLWMGGVRNGRSDGDVAVEALRAGVDVLLMPPDVAAAVGAVEAALADGSLSVERLDEAVARVLTLKGWLGLPL